MLYILFAKLHNTTKLYQNCDIVIILHLFYKSIYSKLLLFFNYTEERPRRPDYGPAASIDISDATINNLLGKDQMLSQDMSADSVIVGSTSELISEINRMFPGENTNKAVNENILDADTTDADNSLYCEKSTGVALLESIRSDLIKFSVTDICEVVNKHTEHTSASTSKHNPADIRKENPEKPLDVTAQYYEYEEVSSQELPVCLNQS